jgi:hypothetical protein
MLRGSPQLSELVVCGSGRVDEQFAAEGEGVEFVFEAEAFELEGSANRQEDMVALGSQRSGGRLCQVGVGLQGFVKHLHLPPFFVDRGDGLYPSGQVHSFRGFRAVMYLVHE